MQYIILFIRTATVISSLDANTEIVLLWTLYLFIPFELILCLFQQSQNAFCIIGALLIIVGCILVKFEPICY